MDKYQEILQKYDDSVRWEYPEEFDYEREQKEFIHAKDALQQLLKLELEFETGRLIQDASFHSRILLNERVLTEEEGYAQIRFSNFGRLISFVNEDEIIEREVGKTRFGGIRRHQQTRPHQ